jgi:hypothetical protein
VALSHWLVLIRYCLLFLAAGFRSEGQGRSEWKRSPARRYSGEAALDVDGEGIPVVLETFRGVDKERKRMVTL